MNTETFQHFVELPLRLLYLQICFYTVVSSTPYGYKRSNVYLPAPSNRWCFNPAGLLNGTFSHPFGTGRAGSRGAYIYSYSICNLSYLDLYQHSRLATKKHVLHLSTPKKTQLTFLFPQQKKHPTAGTAIRPPPSRSVRRSRSSVRSGRKLWDHSESLILGLEPEMRRVSVIFLSIRGPAMSRVHESSTTKSLSTGGGSVGWLVGWLVVKRG